MLEQLLQLIRSAKIDLSCEKRAQADLELLLKQAGIQFKREVRLSAGDIVDFLVGDIAIELKLKGSKKMDIYKQLLRYAKHNSISVLILASNLSMGLPEQIDGKDCYYVRLGEGWL